MINKKVLILLIAFALLNNCSFDNKTGIWGDSAKEKKKNFRIRKRTKRNNKSRENLFIKQDI